MPHITLPCTLCGASTDWQCSSCRQPTCLVCLNVWRSKDGKGSRGYRCDACAQGLREEVRVKRVLPTVTRVYTCMACRDEVCRHTAKTFSHSARGERLSHDELVKLLFVAHRQRTGCRKAGMAIEFSYRYDDDQPNEGTNEGTTQT